jgi:hypothetical protein
MTDPPRHSETEEDPGQGHHGAANNAPRWVFVLGIIIAIALVGLMVLLHLTGTIGPGVH